MTLHLPSTGIYQVRQPISKCGERHWYSLGNATVEISRLSRHKTRKSRCRVLSAMVLTDGGPCVGQARRKNQEPAQLCAAVSAHKWYTGPICKNCYLRNKTESGKHPKLAKTEDAPAESGGDIPLVCLRVSAARCALPPCYTPAYSARPQPARLHCSWTRQPTCPVGLHRLSVIPRTLVDRSNPPPESDDDEGDEGVEYDVYGWFKFESDADGVRRLDRQWVPLHDLEQAEGWKAAVLKLEEKLKKASSDLVAGGSPARSTES